MNNLDKIVWIDLSSDRIAVGAFMFWRGKVFEYSIWSMFKADIIVIV